MPATLLQQAVQENLRVVKTERGEYVNSPQYVTQWRFQGMYCVDLVWTFKGLQKAKTGGVCIFMLPKRASGGDTAHPPACKVARSSYK